VARQEARPRQIQATSHPQPGLACFIVRFLTGRLYIDAALQQLRAEGFPVLPEDVARLSPLVYEHINLLGRYAFSVPEAVQRGQLRPLRTSSEAIEELS
jgi:hypothetical protein